MIEQSTTTSTLTVEFCGEEYVCDPSRPFTVGRDADLSVDSNLFLHRRLLEFVNEAGLWWVRNIGQALSVSLSTGDGTYQAMIGPGARVPLVFPHMLVMFSAGSFTYELVLSVAEAAYAPGRTDADQPLDGTETLGGVQLTPSQRLLLVALCEPMLKAGAMSIGELPSSAAVAARLGWPITTFNRKLDAVCDKLDRSGVPGLRGGVGKLARNRKTRLVEYAILSRLVTVEDLAVLDAL